MNPFLLPPDQRLTHWRDFRKSLMTLDDYQKLVKVAEYWACAPLMAIAYDVNDASHWPTPWEMVHSNEWDRNSVAIGMESTLRLADVSADRMALRLILDRVMQLMLLVLVVDSTWVLNYDWGSVITYPKTARIIKEWRYTGKNYCSRSD